VENWNGKLDWSGKRLACPPSVATLRDGTATPSKTWRGKRDARRSSHIAPLQSHRSTPVTSLQLLGQLGF